MRPYRKILQIALITFIIITIIMGIIYLFLKYWEGQLVREREAICEERAHQIASQVEEDEKIQTLMASLMQGDSIYLASSRETEEALTGIVRTQVENTEGLEGGFYLLVLDDFIGYAFPTSDPPRPVYGPPPRSYNIIKEQVLRSIAENKALLDLHAFDPAIFPLATHPFKVKGVTAGAVWIRIHIERDLPVVRLRQVLYIVTVVFGIGFVIFVLFSWFLRNGIRNIQHELMNTRKDTRYRLELRGGLFGFIPRRINEMLDSIESEYKQRLELEKQLHHKEKLALMGKMIAAVAHEIKSPMAIIKTRVQMWESSLKQCAGEVEGLDIESMGMVSKEIKRVSDLLKRLLVFSRPIYENMKPTLVEDVIGEVIRMMDFNRPGTEIHLKTKLEESRYMISSDPDSLKQVFINILNNADESLGNSGEIVVETIYDTVKGSVTVKISDTGQGIDENIVENIFDPFYTTKATGSGLGLAISREIISYHKGTIKFLQNKPRGTVCLITLPLINKLQ